MGNTLCHISSKVLNGSCGPRRPGRNEALKSPGANRVQRLGGWRRFHIDSTKFACYGADRITDPRPRGVTVRQYPQFPQTPPSPRSDSSFPMLE